MNRLNDCVFRMFISFSSPFLHDYKLITDLNHWSLSIRNSKDITQMYDNRGRPAVLDKDFYQNDLLTLCYWHNLSLWKESSSCSILHIVCWMLSYSSVSRVKFRERVGRVYNETYQDWDLSEDGMDIISSVNRLGILRWRLACFASKHQRPKTELGDWSTHDKETWTDAQRLQVLCNHCKYKPFLAGHRKQCEATILESSWDWKEIELSFWLPKWRDLEVHLVLQ